ncbi:DUF1971 domain-containing protein [Malonomonas rubra]|uniref:DUF1971 domain-containing protein n=1 Tax=Malonomonas rubra TaxID=57040 RepID=UPI0026EA2204|nr:DUF1971 domain-containing protein [Malonomonas rubra]
MVFQNEILPFGVNKVGSTPMLTEKTVPKGILKKHLAPKGKIGLLVVEEGSLQFVWEDSPDEILDADPEHPIVIWPERLHHVVVNDPVRFQVEFYGPAQILDAEQDLLEGDRLGEG